MTQGLVGDCIRMTLNFAVCRTLHLLALVGASVSKWNGGMKDDIRDF